MSSLSRCPDMVILGYELNSGDRYGDEMAEALCTGLAIRADKMMDATVLVLIGRVDGSGKLSMKWYAFQRELQIHLLTPCAQFGLV